jgi:hypothetical protein
MKYKVIEDIIKYDNDAGAKIGDILTVGWLEEDCGCWALFNDKDEYVCDLGSRFGTHNCEEIKPDAEQIIMISL